MSNATTSAPARKPAEDAIKEAAKLLSKALAEADRDDNPQDDDKKNETEVNGDSCGLVVSSRQLAHSRSCTAWSGSYRSAAPERTLST
jgi:hypothetical protein